MGNQTLKVVVEVEMSRETTSAWLSQDCKKTLKSWLESVKRYLPWTSTNLLQVKKQMKMIGHSCDSKSEIRQCRFWFGLKTQAEISLRYLLKWWTWETVLTNKFSLQVSIENKLSGLIWTFPQMSGAIKKLLSVSIKSMTFKKNLTISQLKFNLKKLV